MVQLRQFVAVGLRFQALADAAPLAVLGFGLDQQVDHLRPGEAPLVLVQQQADLRQQAARAVFRHHHPDLAGGQFHQRTGRIDSHRLDKGLHQFGLELDVPCPVDDPDRLRGRYRRGIAPMAGECVVGVHDGRNTGHGRNILPAKPLRITRSIVALVMVGHHVQHVLVDHAAVPQQFDPVLHVFAHLGQFAIGQGPGRLQQLGVHAEFADIHQHAADGQ